MIGSVAPRRDGLEGSATLARAASAPRVLASCPAAAILPLGAYAATLLTESRIRRPSMDHQSYADDLRGGVSRQGQDAVQAEQSEEEAGG
mgnify:CR=1 FL=1